VKTTSIQIVLQKEVMRKRTQLSWFWRGLVTNSCKHDDETLAFFDDKNSFDDFQFLKKDSAILSHNYVGLYDFNIIKGRKK